MMKNDRQAMILDIISQENIETQEQLLARLREKSAQLGRAADENARLLLELLERTGK